MTRAIWAKANVLPVFVVLQCLDVLTTLIFLSKGVREGNPLLLWTTPYVRAQWMGLIAVKLLAVLIGFYCYRHGRTAALRLAKLRIYRNRRVEPADNRRGRIRSLNPSRVDLAHGAQDVLADLHRPESRRGNRSSALVGIRRNYSDLCHQLVVCVSQWLVLALKTFQMRTLTATC